MRGDDLLTFQQRQRPRHSIASARFVDLNPDYSQDRNDILTTEQVTIRRQIKNVLSTPYGSEYHEPTYGSNIPFRIYEAMGTQQIIFLLETDTLVALNMWMASNISVNMSRFLIAETEAKDGYRIDIPYRSAASGITDEYSFEVLR